MATNDNAVRRQLNAACHVIRSGEAGDVPYLSNYLIDSSQADALLSLIIQCWRDTIQSSGSCQAVGISITGTASELLRVAIGIQQIAYRAIKTIIECIQSGQVSGRTAIYCISEVRIAPLSTDAIDRLVDEDSLIEAVENARSIAEQCIRPFFAANKNQLHLQESSICLDLFPDAINTLSSLRKKLKRSKKLEIEVLDTFLSNEWHSAGFLPICCTLSEVYAHLKTRHLEELKRRLLTSTDLLQTKQCEDFAGVLRVCLRMFEQSRDASWIHVLRVLHSNVPHTEVQTVEALLEQVFSQTPLLCLQVVAVIEDACVHMMRVIGTSAYANIAADSTSSKWKEKSINESARTGVSGGDIPDVIRPTCYATHTEFEGIPMATNADIHLLLVCSRSSNRGQRVEGEVQLPAMLLDCSNEPLPCTLSVSRAILLAVLSQVVLKEYVHLLKMSSGSVEVLQGGSGAVSLSHCQSSSHSETETHSNTSLYSTETTGKNVRKPVYSYKPSNDEVHVERCEGRFMCISEECAGVVAAVLSSSGHTSRYTDYSYFKTLFSNSSSSSAPPSSSSSSSSSFSFSSSRVNSNAHYNSNVEHSSSEHCSENVSWINSANASEILSACLFLSCCPPIVSQCVCLAEDALHALSAVSLKHWSRYDRHRVGTVQSSLSDVASNIRISGGAESFGQEGEYPLEYDGIGVRREEHDVRVNHPNVIASLLVSVFSMVPGCRPSVLASVLKGILECSENSSESSGISSRSKGTMKKRNTKNVQSAIIKFGCSVFHRSLSMLCERHPYVIAGMNSTLDSYIPMLSLVPLPFLPLALLPIIRIAGLEADTLGCVLNACMKMILHKDTARKSFAVRSLIVLLPSVKENDQIKVLYTLLHAFSLQLPCRRVLYAELTKLLKLMKKKKRKKKKGVRRNGSTNSCSIEDGENGRGNEGEYPLADENTCSLYLSPQVISTLFRKVSTRLSSFLTTTSNTLQDEDPGPTFQSHKSSNNHSMYGIESGSSRGRRIQPEYDCTLSRTIVCTKKCIQSFRTLRGYEFSLAEDLPLLMELSYALAEHSSNSENEEHSSEEEIISDMIHIAGIISHPENNPLKSRKSLDLSFQDLTRNDDEDLGSLDFRYSDDLGPTGSFLLALLNFIAAGFPLPILTHRYPDKKDEVDLGSDSSIDAHGRSINMDIPLSGTVIAVGSVSASSTDRSAHVTDCFVNVTEDEKMKKEEQHQLLVTHFACCYGLLSGLLICLTRTLSTVSSSHNDAVEDKAVEGDDEGVVEGVTLDAMDNRYKCSDSGHSSSATISSLECAVVSIQGLLDLVLEISVDLSSTSTSTSTPVQTPSTIPGSKVPSNVAPEASKVMTMSVNVKGHASLSKLATAKLTGMSSQLLLKNDSVNGLRGSGFNSLSVPVTVPVPMGDGMCSSLTVHESVLLINTALSAFKCKHSSSSIGDEDAYEGRDADFNKSVSVPDTSTYCNTTITAPLHPPDLHTHTEQHAHSTTSLPHDTPPHPPSLLHLPISVRLGAVGHACHQAAVTAISILSLSSSQYPSSSSSREHSMSSECDDNVTSLGGLLLLVFEAYRTVGSIGVEDSFLEDAADAAEQLLRGQQDTRNGTSSSSNKRSDDVSADLGSKRCRQIPDSHNSIHSSKDSTQNTLYHAATRHNDRGRGSNQGLSFFSASSSSSHRDGDRTRISSDNGGNGVGVGVPLSSGHMGWSDDSSDASENDSTYNDDVTTHTCTHPPSSLKSKSRSRVRPFDLFSLAVQNLPEGVKGRVERYDMHCQASDVYVTEFDGAVTGMRTRANSSATRSLHSNSASERCVQRVRAIASETLRYTLFSIRCEMLWAASRILRVIATMSYSGGGEEDFNFHQQHLTIGRTLRSAAPSAPKGFLSDIKRLELATFTARDLGLAIADGLTIRTLKAYLDVLLVMIEGCRIKFEPPTAVDVSTAIFIPSKRNSFLINTIQQTASSLPSLSSTSSTFSPSSSTIQQCKTSTTPTTSPTINSSDPNLIPKSTTAMSGVVVLQIQHVLRFLDLTHQAVLSPIVHLLMEYSGPWRALSKCEELIRTIGSLQFAVKEKKKRKAETDIDNNTAPRKSSITLSEVAVKRPLTMSTRSANVELNSSSTIRLTHVMKVQGPSDEGILGADSEGQNDDSEGDMSDRERERQIKSLRRTAVTHTDQCSTDKSSKEGQGVRAGVGASVCDTVSAGIVTAKSSDAILGHVLRHVEKCLASLSRHIAGANSSSNSSSSNIATNVSVSNSGVAYHTALDGSTDGSEPFDTSYENKLLSKQICMCVFSLFTGYLLPGYEESTVDTAYSAAIAASVDGDAVTDVPVSVDYLLGASRKSDGYRDRGGVCATPTNSTSAVKEGDVTQETSLSSDQILLSNVSERRRCQALSLATRFMLYCNKDCTRLLRDIVAVHKSRAQTWNVGVGKSLGSKRKKRGYGFSDSEEEEEEEMEKMKEREKEKGKGQCDGEEDDSDGDEKSSAAPLNRSAPVNSLPDTATKHPVDRKDSYCFLSALLTATEPSTVISAKDWTLRKNNTTSSSSTSSSSSSSSSSNTKKQHNSAQTPSISKNAATSGAASEKHAHSLVFKIEELEWRLLQIKQEIDRHRGVHPAKKRKQGVHVSWEGGSTSATSTSSYPPDLCLLIDLMDLKGRELIRCLQKSSSESARTNCKDTYRPWAGYNGAASKAVDERKGAEKGKRRINSDGDSEDEDEGCSVSYDSDGSESQESIASDEDIDDDVSDNENDDEGEDGGADKGSKSKRRTKGLPIISKRSQASISNAASSKPSIRSSSRRSKGVGGTSRSSRLRSRNSVIDDWLGDEDEDGSDTYADLEDFLVE